MWWPVGSRVSAAQLPHIVFLFPLAPQSLLEQLPQEDPDYVYNTGCLLFQDGKYEEACKKFSSAMQVLGYVPGSQLRHGYTLKGLWLDMSAQSLVWRKGFSCRE